MDDKIKIQVLMSIDCEKDFERFMCAYQIDDFVSAINEILNMMPEVSDVLDKHDILKFF